MGLRLRERSLQLILCALCYQALIFFVVRVFPPPRLNCSQFWVTSWADHGYVLGNSRAPAEKKKNRKKIEARFTLYTTSQPGTKNITELFDEWMIEPVWAMPKTDFWPVCYRLKLALALKTICLMQEWCSLFFCCSRT